jgi:hypothetical protein
MKEPSVETKIGDILFKSFDSTTFGGGFNYATSEILALFSTQQAQMREEIERQVIDKSMVADGCKVVLWADVLAIIEEKR